MQIEKFRRKMLSKLSTVQELISAKSGEGDLIAAVRDAEDFVRGYQSGEPEALPETENTQAVDDNTFPIHTEAPISGSSESPIDPIQVSTEEVTASDPTQTAGSIPS